MGRKSSPNQPFLFEELTPAPKPLPKPAITPITETIQETTGSVFHYNIRFDPEMHLEICPQAEDAFNRIRWDVEELEAHRRLKNPNPAWLLFFEARIEAYRAMYKELHGKQD